MKGIDSAREDLRRFLAKRRAEGLTDEIIGLVRSLSSNSNFSYYLPAVAYVVLRDKHGVAISASELKAEGIGQVKAKFIVKVRERLGIERSGPVVASDQIETAIERICKKLALASTVQAYAKRLNEALMERRVCDINEFYCYSASLVYVSAKSKEGLMTQESIIRQLDISPHFLRKYSRIITSEMGSLNL